MLKVLKGPFLVIVNFNINAQAKLFGQHKLFLEFMQANVAPRFIWSKVDKNLSF
jgi:hypothetical protein